MRVTEANVDLLRRQSLAALSNEQLTRERVERLEHLLARGFWGRLRWLVLGR